MIFWAPNTSPSVPICFECSLKFLNKSMNSSKHTKKLEDSSASFWIKNQKIVWKSMLKSTLITKMLEFDNTLLLSQVVVFKIRSTCQISWQNSNIFVIRVDFRFCKFGVSEIKLKSTLITKMLEFDYISILSLVFIFQIRSTCQISWQNSNIFVIRVDFSIDFQTIFWFFIQNEDRWSSNFLVYLLLFIDLLKNLREHSKQMGTLGDVLGAQKIMGGFAPYNKNVWKFKCFKESLQI